MVSVENNTYIDELNRLGTVSSEDRLKIVESVYKDKKKAAKTLPLLYLKDVVDIAKLYEGQGVYNEDLIGEGNIALCLCSENLDLCENAKEVEEFLIKTVMDAMEKLITEQSAEEDIDIKIAERVNNVFDAAKEMSEALLRRVSVSELALEMEVDEGVIREAIRLSGNRIDYIEVETDEN